jgi:hypothetical protein
MFQSEYADASPSETVRFILCSPVFWGLKMNELELEDRWPPSTVHR